MAGPSSNPQVQSRLDKLGIRTRLDFALHLPLRYEDETTLTPLAQARAGEPVQVEAEVVKLRETTPEQAGDTRGETFLWVRFLNFYPSQVKQFAPGKRFRLFGEVRPGFFGDEMVHPRYRVIQKGAPLPKS